MIMPIVPMVNNGSCPSRINGFSMLAFFRQQKSPLTPLQRGEPKSPLSKPGIPKSPPFVIKGGLRGILDQPMEKRSSMNAPFYPVPGKTTSNARRCGIGGCRTHARSGSLPALPHFTFAHLASGRIPGQAKKNLFIPFDRICHNRPVKSRLFPVHVTAGTVMEVIPCLCEDAHFSGSSFRCL